MLENHLKIVIGIHRLVKDIDHETSLITRKYELTVAQFAVLEALLHKGNLTVGEIRDKVLSSNGTIPVVIQNLLKLNYVIKTTDAKDRRKSYIALSSKGKDIIANAYIENEKMIQDKLSIYSEEEKELLVSFLKKYQEVYE